MKFFYIVLVLTLGSQSMAADKKELMVYTERATHLIQPLFDAYAKKTGIKVNHINGKAGALTQRLKQEGSETPADLLITVDAGNLWNAAEIGLLEPIKSEKLDKRIPSELKDSKNRWFGLSLRARTIFYNKDKVKAEDLKSYADLGTPQWKGKLCLRTSTKVYNQSLVAAMIERLGEKETKKDVQGWVSNLAKPVFTSDSILLEAVDNGACPVGIANTYYFARLVRDGKGKNVGVFWPNQDNGGVHVNISGGGVVKGSHNKKEATDFLEWLTSDEAQKLFAELNNEYPVVDGVSLSPIIKKWGSFSRDKTPLDKIGPNQKKAVLIMDQAKYL
jgi:iron(III) transport system substrate-binding protein